MLAIRGAHCGVRGARIDGGGDDLHIRSGRRVVGTEPWCGLRALCHIRSCYAHPKQELSQQCTLDGLEQNM